MEGFYLGGEDKAVVLATVPESGCRADEGVIDTLFV